MLYSPTTPDTGESSSRAQKRIDRQSSGPSDTIWTSPCGRCTHIYEYEKGTPWSHVSRMVNDHWRVCPNGISATMARHRQNLGDVGGIEKSVSRSRKREEVASPAEESTRVQILPRKKNTMDEQARKRDLESDRWAAEVTPKSVKCRACGRNVSLDKRSMYYPGLWRKHRGKCVEIQRLEALARDESIDESMSETKGKSVSDHYSDLPRAPSDTNMDMTDMPSIAEFEEQNRYQEAAGETWKAGQGYDILSPSNIGRNVDRSEYSEETMQRTNHRHSEITDPPYSQRDFGQYRPHSIDRRVSSSSDGCYEDEAYWSRAPFATNNNEPPDKTQERWLYRNSTQWELSSNFRDSSTFM